jgi:hypothetical protein
MATSWKFNPDNTIEDKDGNKVDFASLVINTDGKVTDIKGNEVEVSVANAVKLNDIEATVYENLLCVKETFIDSDTDINVGGRYVATTTDNSLTCTLPNDPNNGDTIVIIDIAGTFGDNAVTLTKSNDDHTINGDSSDVDLNVSRKIYTVIFKDNNWSVFY